MHVCNEPHRNGLWGTQVSHGALGAVKRWRVSGSRTFAAAAAALLLAGCAANLPQEDTPAPEQVEAQAQPPVVPPKPVYAPLDGEVLYKIMVAEVAARRGEMRVAMDHYYDTAKTRRDPGLAERGTRIAVYAQNREQSLRHAQLWAELSPNSLEAVQVLGALKLRQDQIGPSAETLKRVRQIEKAPGPSYARLVNLLGREKNRSGAMSVLKKIVEAEPDLLEARFAIAELASRTGLMPLADAELTKLNEQYPENERVVEYRARVLQSLNKSTEARELLEGFLARNPNAQRARMSYGRLLVGERRFEEAATTFATLVEADDNAADARYALAIVYMQLRNYKAAGENFQSLVDRGQRRYEASYYLGQLAERDDNEEEALAAYRRVERGEFALNAQIRAANLLARQKQLTSARSSLQNLRRLYPSEAVRLYRAEGDILVRSEQLDEAMAVYSDALESKPQNTDLLYARAMVAARADNIKNLERDLRDILSREPDNADALNALGYTLADKTTRYDEAYALIQRAVKIKPDDHYVIDSLGWVLYRLKRYEEAVVQLRRAWNIRADAEVGAHLGEVLWVMGKKDEARQIWKEALDAAADKQKIADVIKRLTE